MVPKANRKCHNWKNKNEAGHQGVHGVKEEDKSSHGYRNRWPLAAMALFRLLPPWDCFHPGFFFFHLPSFSPHTGLPGKMTASMLDVLEHSYEGIFSPLILSIL